MRLDKTLAESVPTTVSSASPLRRSDRIDRILTFVTLGLVVAVLGVGAYLGWAIYTTTINERTATPALRVIDDLKNNVRRAPNSAPLRVRLGEAYAAAGMNVQAKEQFVSAVQIDKKHVGAWLDLGLVAMEERKFQAAQGYFQKVYDLTQASTTQQSVDSPQETALFNLGVIAVEQRRYEDAVGYLKGALRIRRDASDTYFYLAKAYIGLDTPDKAAEMLKISTTFDPQFAEAQYTYGVLFAKQHDDLNAAEHLRQAADLAPKSNQLAQQALAKLGKAEDRVAQAKKLLASGDKKKALEQARIAYALDPSNLEAVKLTAGLQMQTGDKSSALDTYRAAEKLAPKDREVLDAIKRLTSGK